MKRCALGVFLSLLCIALASPLAYAQGSATSSITGVVTDAGGGAVPGAVVVAKNTATAVTTQAVTNSSGNYTVPSIDVGRYTVTITLSGFKTVVVDNVVVLAAGVATVNATLEVGTLNETVNVKANSEMIQTTSSTVQTTMTVDQIAGLPLVSRNALNFMVFLPGVETPGTARASTVNGLPQSTLSISIDGVNVQDNFNKTGDGFFARVTPRLDAVEQVTVSSAGAGADSAGQGAVTIKFVTRSGTNQYSGSGYYYFRHPSLNSNSYFNKVNGLEKNDIIVNQPGGRFGGPILVPKVYDGRGKAFFFANYEEFRQPTQITRTRTILTTGAQTGLFSYTTAAGTQNVNLLALAAANGQTPSIDTTIAALLVKIRTATGTTGVINPNTPITESYVYQADSKAINQYPTFKIDYNLNDTNRLSYTYNFNHIWSEPDILNSAEARFPGLLNSGIQNSYRYTSVGRLRSTLSSSMVNEVGVGGAWGPTYFGYGVETSHFSDQNGYSLGFPLITSVTTTTAPSSRQAANWFVEDTMTWTRGKHNLSMGGTFTQFDLWLTNQTLVPTTSLGLNTTFDPSNAMFTTTNFPGASTGQLSDARNLYALLTGRVTSVNGNVRLNADTGVYDYLGKSTARGKMNEFGAYIQDSWRVSSTITANIGVRYQLQMPFQPTNDIYSMVTFDNLCGVSGLGQGPDGRNCNLFKPGTLTGSPSVFQAYDAGNPGYNTDFNNLAPSVGMTWRPNAQNGMWRKLLGDPEQAVVRGAYSVAYNRNGMGDFSGTYGSNPGQTVTTNRNVNNGNLVLPGESWPLLFRENTRLGPPATCPAGTINAACVPASPSYPVAATTANSLNLFDPELEISFSRSYSIGIQRSIGRDTAVEVRYLGTRNVGGWTDEDWNAVNIYENGFLDEWKAASANLYANLAAGRGNTFAYMGPGTNTAPLPIYLAYFQGLNNAAAQIASNYTSTNFTNASRLEELSRLEPSVGGAAGTLIGSATFRQNALNAGLARNFFVMNPDVDSAVITRSKSFTRYDSLQIDVRRRLSRGFLIQGSYVFAHRWGSALDDLHFERYLQRSSGTIPHNFKVNWVYEVPVGRGKRFGTDMNPWLNGFVGNWEINGTGRWSSQPVGIGSNVRIVGMSLEELQSEYYERYSTDPTTGRGIITLLPDDIILNTRRAYSTSVTSANGYSALGAPEGRYLAPASTVDCQRILPGDCGIPRDPRIIHGSMFIRFDISAKKRIPFGRKANFEVEVDILNVMDRPNFNMNFNPGEAETIFRVTSAYSDVNGTNDPGGRIGQLVWRVTW